MRPHLLPVLPLGLSFVAACAPPGPLHGIWVHEDVPEGDFGAYYNARTTEVDGCTIRDERRLAFDGEGRVFPFAVRSAVCEDASYSYTTGVGTVQAYTRVGSGEAERFEMRLTYAQVSCQHDGRILDCGIRNGEDALSLRFRRLGASERGPSQEG